MLKRHPGGQELGELVSTVRNTYVNAGILGRFDFHQSGNRGGTVWGEEEGVEKMPDRPSEYSSGGVVSLRDRVGALETGAGKRDSYT
jgi:hypothetical protein